MFSGKRHIIVQNKSRLRLRSLGFFFQPTYTEVCLALGAMVFGFSPQNPAAAVRRVPAEIAR